MRRRKKPDLGVLLDRCLAAFVEAGTIELSLDQLARKAGSSKRMLVHYFGGREALEEQAIALLEHRLRAQFTQSFPPRATARAVVSALWERATAPQARGVLLLTMDLSRRAWFGSKRAQLFYAEQQRLWTELLMQVLPNRASAEEVLQAFQGAVLAFLVTGDREPGRRALMRILAGLP